MACVPKSGKARQWFTDLAKQLNISEEWLEPRVHSFWAKYGEEAIPTVENMREFIEGVAPSNLSPAQVELLNTQYKSPIKVNTLQEAENVAREAMQYFPQESVVTKQTNDGHYEVSVTKQSNTTVNQKESSIESTLESKPITTAEEVLSLLSFKEKTPGEQKLAELVFKTAKELGVQFKNTITDKESIGIVTSGKYVADENTVYLNINNLQSNTILHEVIHSITSYYLKQDSSKFSKEIQAAIKEINYCYDLLKQDFIETNFYENGTLKKGINLEKAFAFWTTDTDTYGYTSPTEMVAELSNPEFVQHIKKFDEKTKGQNIFQKLIDSVLTLLGIKDKKYSSVEKTVKDALITLVTNPNKSLLDQYSIEIKNIKDNINEINNNYQNDVIHLSPSSIFLDQLTDSKNEQSITMSREQFKESFVISFPENATTKFTELQDGTIGVVNQNRNTGVFIFTSPVQVDPNQTQVTFNIQLLDMDALKSGKLNIEVKDGVAVAINYKDLINNTIKTQTEINAKTEQQSQNYFEYKQKEIDRQADALSNNTEGLTQTEIQEFADECVYWLSDKITEYMANPELVFTETEFFRGLQTLDEKQQWSAKNHRNDIARLKRMSRQEFIKALGIDNLMALVKESLFNENRNEFLKSDDVELDAIAQAQFLYDNFDALFRQANTAFFQAEKMSLVYNDRTETVETTDEINIDEDNMNESNDIDARKESQEKEGWSIESRTVDVINSMSSLVYGAMQGLYQIESFNPDGSPVYKRNKFGVNKRITVKDATGSLLKWIQGSVSYSDMLTRISEKLSLDENGLPTANMWVKPLYDKLKIVEGQDNINTDFQSQFFSVFNKHFQPYSVVVKNADGTYTNLSINERPALKQMQSSIISLFNTDEHPLFSKTDGIKRTAYDSLKKINEELQQITTLNNRVKTLEEVKDSRDKILDLIDRASNLLGYFGSKEMIDLTLNNDKALQDIVNSLNYMVQSLSKELDNKYYNPFKFDRNANPNGIYGNLKTFLSPLTEMLEDTAISSFYDSGKMYQSYVTPSYLTKMMTKFHKEGKAFDDFMLSEFGQTEWFHLGSSVERGWTLNILKELANMSSQERSKVFNHKVALSFNGHNYMKGMSETEYALSVLVEYANSNNAKVGWFRVPMMSNKPSAEYISYYKVAGDFSEGVMSDAKKTLVDGFYKIFLQEVSRINTCNERANNKEHPITESSPEYIQNLDKNGKKFCFLDFLNKYLNDKKGTELGKLLNDKIAGKQNIDENRLNDLIKEEIVGYIDSRATKILNDYKNTGVVDALKSANIIQKITEKNNQETEDMYNARVENFIREFVWNDTYMAMNILELTITDKAQYKNEEDLQKRLAEIHAPGLRGNVEATDYKGRRVSDGTYRVLVLKDFDGFKSNIIENIGVVFNQKIDAAPEEQKAQWKALKESLVGDKGAYRKINIADAQAYNCLTSLRKKAFMFGKWDTAKEELYQRIKDGDYKFNEVQKAFSQVWKPFTYSHLSVASNAGDNAFIKNFRVGTQYKDSEYLLLMADALLHKADTGKPNLLKVLSEVMEESHYGSTKTEQIQGKEVHIKGDYKDSGIDTILFESAVKTGLFGTVDLRGFSNLYEEKYAKPEEAEKEAKAYLKSLIYDEEGKYNKTYVKETSFEDYSVQQEVPEHFIDHKQAEGSQTRYIMPSDLEETNSRGEAVTYDYYDPATKTVKKLGAKEFKKKYEEVHAQNIQESIDNLKRELFFDDEHIDDVRSQNEALSKILQREVLSSPRYGIDLFYACSIDPQTGNFRIPLGDPIQSRRIEQLLNSVIKNRVNKQKLPGGPVVQVSNFGCSKQLNIRFNDENGNLIPLESEYKGSVPYKEYLKEHQGGIAYWEVFTSVPSEAYYQFMDKNGIIDIKAIEKVNPDLLKLLSYRIPTEDKYSIMPLKIVGFLPREAGEGIIMPNDLTEITDADFDVDKMYLIHKALEITRKDRKVLQQELYDVLRKYKVFDGRSNQYIKEQIRTFLDNPELTYDDSTEAQAMMFAYRNLGFETKIPTVGKDYRDNIIFDMDYAVLTHETTADKMLNPGGFEVQKKMGYLIEAQRLHPEISWEELESKTTNELSDLCYTEKNLCFIDTHTQFYKQNSAAGVVLGMFATQKVSHACFEGDRLLLNVDDACKLEQIPVLDSKGQPMYSSSGEPITQARHFTVAGMEFGGMMEIDSSFDVTGVNRIGKTLGAMVASAADAVKAPVLNLMNINQQTASVLNYMLRMRMPFESIALFLSSKVITDTLNEFNSKSITKFESLKDIIQNRITDLQNEYGFEDSVINEEELTKEELIKGLTSEDPRIQYKTLKTWQKFQSIAKEVRSLTTASKLNSIQNAVGPLVIDNLILENSMENFSKCIYFPDGMLVKNIGDVLKIHPILSKFAEAIDIAKSVFSDMPANSSNFRGLLDYLKGYGTLKDTFMNDRKLLSQLSDFYQSYILESSDVFKRMCDIAGIEEGFRGLKYYIEKFPKAFFAGKAKERYKGNFLIDSIRLDTLKNGLSVLKIDTTGLDITYKQKLQNAWADLHRLNPKLSVELFMYNFYRAGIGFSPKTFMSMLPTFVKTSAEFKPYLELFQKLPSVSNGNLIDQFIRNNSDNSKLVPFGKDLKFTKKDGTYILSDKKQIETAKEKPYIKIKFYGVDTILKLEGENSITGNLEYKVVEPLGDGKSYLEISEKDINRSIESERTEEEKKRRQQEEEEMKKAEAEFSVEDLTENNGVEEKADNVVENTAEEEVAPQKYSDQYLEETLTNLYITSKYPTREAAKSAIEVFRNKSAKDKASLESSMKKFFRNSLEKKNVLFDEQLIDELFKKLC